MKLLKILGILFLGYSIAFGQFGQNRLQYKDFEWYFIQTKHFDIYFTSDGTTVAEFTASAAEEAVENIQSDFDYEINNRISLIVYNSHNDFQETNTIDAFVGQGTGGFTERFKNRVVFPFEGSYEKFRHVIHHELVHAVMNDMLYGGTIQNIISKGITLDLPIWVHEGMAEYISSDWETNSDMFIRDAVINEYLPDIKYLNGYFAYRGGQSLFKFIAETYGREKVGDILRKTKGQGNFDSGIKSSLGLDIDELNERWKKYLKKEFWPAVAEKPDPDEFAKRLTDNKKTGGFYNTSPALSPRGDKIAFISDRDIYLDIYLMNATDGEIIKRVIKTGQSNDFEEMNVLFPALTWAPDNKRIALSVKSNGHDVIKIIDVESEDSYELPFEFNGIESVSWSNDENKIAFVGSTNSQSDIYIYDFATQKVSNITQDIFSDSDPSWSPDDKKIFFSSDRGDYIDEQEITNEFQIYEHNFKQLDIYYADLVSEKITRITDWELSSEGQAVVSADGKYILFVSDRNGISNIYRKKIILDESDEIKSILDLPAIPVTNSLNGINQLSASADRKKLVFTSLFKGGYNIFILNNPFELEAQGKELVPTKFMAGLLNQGKVDLAQIDSLVAARAITDSSMIDIVNKIESDSTNNQRRIYTGQYVQSKDSTAVVDNEYKNFIFGEHFTIKDTSNSYNKEIKFTEKLDKNGNFLVNKYKISFTPDLIYANAGYSTYYGLLGTTVLSFSDLLGDHRLIGVTSLQIDLKNSDYGLAYYYLGKRLDFGFEGFHTARFIYVSNGLYADLYRYRSYGGIASASYPLNRFDRIDGG
ncbi:MAG: peptidase MA family metallohydrolase, partial [bacterium]